MNAEIQRRAPTLRLMTLGRFRLIYQPSQGLDRTAFKLVSAEHASELRTYQQWAELLSTARAHLVDFV
jgi:hypothetical protein